MLAFAFIALFATIALASTVTLADTAVRARGAFVALRGELEREKNMIRCLRPLPRARRAIPADRRWKAGEPLTVRPRAAA